MQPCLCGEECWDVLILDSIGPHNIVYVTIKWIRTAFVLGNQQTVIETKQQSVANGRSGKKILSLEFLLNFVTEL